MKNLTIGTLALLFAFVSFGERLFAQSMGETGVRKEDRHCGAKCLYVIMRGYGKAPSTYKSVVEELGSPSADGYSLMQLSNSARKHGLFAENVKLEKEDLSRFANSCSVILHLNNVRGTNRGHYVICEGITKTTATIFDASVGIPSQMSHEIFSLWTGNALIISKSPIDLSMPTKKSSLSWLGYLCIFALIVSCLIGLARYAHFFRGKWVANACLLVVFAIQNGCSSKQESSQGPLAQNDANAKSASQVLPPVSSGLWVDKSVCNAGTLRRSVTPVLVPVKIHNSKKEPITIKDSRYSFSCLFAKFSSLTIEPHSSIECTLMLQCATLGVKQSKAVFLTDSNEQISIDVSWSVVASLKTEPETFNGMELKCGESKVSSAHLTQLEPFDFSKLEVKSLLDETDAQRFFTATARIEGENLLATFMAGKESPTGLVNGKFVIGIPGDEVVSVTIPFTVYVANDIDVSPAKVYFTKRGDIFHAQVLIFANEVGTLAPIELNWIGNGRSKCEFTLQDQKETQVIDIAVSPETVAGVHQIEVSVAGGKTLKQLPVFFPSPN